MDSVYHYGGLLGSPSALCLCICYKVGARFGRCVDRYGLGYDDTMCFGRTEVQVRALEVCESLGHNGILLLSKGY